MAKNLVLCLDGTSNEPEHGATNVTRIYQIAQKDERQLVYYDPGVGTMGARGAVTSLGQALREACAVAPAMTLRRGDGGSPVPGRHVATATRTSHRGRRFGMLHLPARRTHRQRRCSRTVSHEQTPDAAARRDG